MTNIHEKIRHKDDLENMANRLAFLASVINEKPQETFINALRKHYEQMAPYEEDEISIFLKEHSKETDKQVAESLAVDWTRLFRGISPDYGPKPPYAGLFISDDGTGVKTIASLERLYAEYGFTKNRERQDRADYLGSILKFTAYLTASGAVSGKNSNHYLSCALMCLNKYVLTWVGSFTQSAIDYTENLFFKGYLPVLKDYPEFVAYILKEGSQWEYSENREE